MASVDLKELTKRLDRPDQWEPPLAQVVFCLRSGHSQRYAFSWAVAIDEPGKRATVRGVAFGLHAMGGLMARLAGGGGLEQQTLVDEGLLRIVDAPLMHFTAKMLTSELATLRLPVVGLAPGAAPDAPAHHVYVPSAAATIALGWSGDGPPGWEPLAAWAHKTRAYLHSLTNPDEPLY
jgi:hypothetical protein